MPKQTNSALLLQSVAEIAIAKLFAPASAANDFDAALTENKAAELLGVSVRTLQAWRFRGGGPRYCKIGRAVRYLRRELVSFQQTHTIGSTAETDARGAA